MEIRDTLLPGVYLVIPERKEDARGFFARTWCQDAFVERGLCSAWVQSSVSYNRRRGTLRGMHYQAAPAEEIKLVRCTAGAMRGWLCWRSIRTRAAADSLLSTSVPGLPIVLCRFHARRRACRARRLVCSARWSRRSG